MKFILFILNFRNSNLNEFDLTKILKKEKRYCLFGPKWAMGFIHEFNNIYLFSIYIIFYYETILTWMVTEGKILWEFFLEIKDVMGSNIPKI
jgi:hypothetical protein